MRFERTVPFGTVVFKTTGISLSPNSPRLFYQIFLGLSILKEGLFGSGRGFRTPMRINSRRSKRRASRRFAMPEHVLLLTGFVFAYQCMSYKLWWPVHGSNV